MSRTAANQRTTKETEIDIALDLDGSGQTDIDTGLPFFSHMLDQLGRHGGIDLKVHASGDLEIDAHHTVEDIGIALGESAGRKSSLHPRNRLGTALFEGFRTLSGRARATFRALPFPRPSHPSLRERHEPLRQRATPDRR